MVELRTPPIRDLQLDWGASMASNHQWQLAKQGRGNPSDNRHGGSRHHQPMINDKGKGTDDQWNLMVARISANGRSR
ncbi:hypothetical protein Nepgr_028056 [Nepenthes gracilis]|uniref:Uncharacterized protein n=1 Tax=Nepenthes gracilis TaxID=150966 RepID=A0AAD3TBM4_NEPGR|nr:hypothetical protein Nepgr_028056 [Nepenthes gracilis]